MNAVGVSKLQRADVSRETCVGKIVGESGRAVCASVKKFHVIRTGRNPAVPVARSEPVSVRAAGGSPVDRGGLGCCCDGCRSEQRDSFNS